MTSDVACDGSMVNSPPHQLSPTQPATSLVCLHRVSIHGSVLFGLGIDVRLHATARGEADQRYSSARHLKYRERIMQRFTKGGRVSPVSCTVIPFVQWQCTHSWSADSHRDRRTQQEKVDPQNSPSAETDGHRQLCYFRRNLPAATSDFITKYQIRYS